MQQAYSSSLDVSEVETGELHNKGQMTIPIDFGANVAIPAARARHGMSPREWLQRAKELAFRQRIDHTLHYHGIDNGTIHFRVPSRSNPGRYHRVEVNIPGRMMTCDCREYQDGNPCGHIGAGLNYLHQIQEVTAEHECRVQHQVDLWSATLHG